MQIYNLDDEQERDSFLSEFEPIRGIALANNLGITGQGAKRKANGLMNYAQNMRAAHSCRIKGDIQSALEYERISDRIYKEDIPDNLKW